MKNPLLARCSAEALTANRERGGALPRTSSGVMQAAVRNAGRMRDRRDRRAGERERAAKRGQDGWS